MTQQVLGIMSRLQEEGGGASGAEINQVRICSEPHYNNELKNTPNV